MQPPKVSTEHPPEDYEAAWTPPPSRLSRTRRVLLAIERNRFTLAVLVIVLLLGGLFLKADRLIRAPDVDAASSTTIEDERYGQGGAPIAPRPVELAHLSVTTQPSRATVYINGDSVGVTPLYDHRLANGMHRISVRKEHFASRDTMLVLDSVTSTLDLSLHAREHPDPVEDSPVATPRSTDTDRLAQARRDTEEREVPSRPQPPPEPDRSAASEPTPPPATSSPPNRTPERPPMGAVRVTSEPAGATVLLDDERVGQTPLTIPEVPGGLHYVALEREGYQATRVAVQVVPQEQRTVHRQLTALMGTLKILARPWGSIYIDEQLHKSESSIWYTVQVPVGTHQVRVVHPQLGRWDQTVLVTANEETAVVANLRGRDDEP